MADEATRKTPQARAVSTAPDVCKTPSGPTLVPVPYPIVGVFNLSTSTKPKVLFTKQEAFTTGSKITKVTGDEAGVGGGVKSGVNISTCEFITYSTTVLAQGENIVRHNDTMWMNNKNTTGKVIFPIGLSANVSPSGGIPDNTDPENKPETSAEETAKQEKKGFWASAWEGAKENVSGKWKGIKDAASDPGKAIGDFAGGVKEAVLHPVETAKKVGGAIKDTAGEAYDAYQKGDMDKLGKMTGSGAVEFGIGALSTKGLDKLGKMPNLGKLGKNLPGGKTPDIDVPKKPNIEAPEKPKVDSTAKKTGGDGSDGAVVTILPWKGPANYSKIVDKQAKSRGRGKEFTKKQKEKILEENRKQNDGYLRSDKDGSILDEPVQSKSGVPANMNQAEVDHVFPKSKGGDNTFSNSQVLSKSQNISKSDGL
jgi:hypothetical protein